jgi:GH24 family phage-related lysozyme (muramidase)
VNRNLKVKLTQEQFDALVSFSFNAGMGSLAKSQLKISMQGNAILTPLEQAS